MKCFEVQQSAYLRTMQTANIGSGAQGGEAHFILLCIFDVLIFNYAF